VNPTGASRESLTSNPELENSLDPKAKFDRYPLCPILEHLPILWGHLMGQSGSFGQARRAARCGAPESQMAGKRRNAADEPLWPTEGRVLWSRGRVALVIRCLASRSAPNHGTK
jgi:hypothetical protein